MGLSLLYRYLNWNPLECGHELTAAMSDLHGRGVSTLGTCKKEKSLG